MAARNSKATLEEVIQHLRQIQSAIEGRSPATVLFLTGEAGIGKTTLLAELRRNCARLSPPPVVAVADCSTPLAGQDVGEVEALQPWALIMASLGGGLVLLGWETRE